MAQHRQNRVSFVCHGCITSAAFVLVMAIMMSSCKTVQTNERIDYHDTTTVQVVHDTTYIVIHDTVFVEAKQTIKTDEGTTIEFAEGGGTYNSRTGEANNVRSVKENKQTEQDTHIRAEWAHSEAAYKATIDSLNTTISDLHTENEKLQQPKDCNHLRIFLWGLAAGIALVFLTKLAIWLIKKYR